VNARGRRHRETCRGNLTKRQRSARTINAQHLISDALNARQICDCIAGNTEHAARGTLR
jgi:hypothetical protein